MEGYSVHTSYQRNVSEHPAVQTNGATSGSNTDWIGKVNIGSRSNFVSCVLVTPDSMIDISLRLLGPLGGPIGQIGVTSVVNGVGFWVGAVNSYDPTASSLQAVWRLTNPAPIGTNT